MRKVLLLSPTDIFPPFCGTSRKIQGIVRYTPPDNELYVLLSNISSQGGPIDIKRPHTTFEYCPRTAFDRLKYKSLAFNPFYFKSAVSLMKKSKADVIQCITLYTAVAGTFLKKMFSRPMVLFQENVEYLKQKRFQAPSYILYWLKKMEKTLCWKADKIVAVSEVDKAYMVDLYGLPPGKIEVIPNCADPEEFSYSKEGAHIVRERYDLDQGGLILTFTGKLDTAQNSTAVRYISNEIAPVLFQRFPKTKIFIVGQYFRSLLKYQRQNVVFTGYVPEPGEGSPSLVDYLSATDIFIAPIDRGSGTRLKILEAAACSRPIISTKIGAEGLNFVNNEEIVLTENTDEEFTGAVLRMIQNPEFRRQIGSKARQKVLNQYNWQTQLTKLNDIYLEVQREVQR